MCLEQGNGRTANIDGKGSFGVNRHFGQTKTNGHVGRVNLESAMIVLITIQEKNERTGRTETVVSHGVDFDTGNNVPMSGGSPLSCGAVFNSELGEWVIER